MLSIKETQFFSNSEVSNPRLVINCQHGQVHIDRDQLHIRQNSVVAGDTGPGTKYFVEIPVFDW